MKIGVSAFVLDKGHSGIYRYTYGLLEGLQKIDQKNQYEVFVSKNDVPLLPSMNRLMSLHTCLNVNQNPVFNILWHNTILPILSYTEQLDLIYLPTIRRIPNLSTRPIIATIHDLAPFKLSKKYDPLRMFYQQKILLRNLKNCARILTVSQSTKRDIIEVSGYPEEKIHVIYPGIDHVQFNTSKSDLEESVLKKYQIDEPFFVYVSRIEHPGKNHLNLIQAFDLFKKETKLPHKLICIGADWTGAKIVKDYANRSEFQKDIVFTGYLANEEVAVFYRQCELMIFPSFYEGFGMPIIEAFACGARVACSNTSSLVEIGHKYVQLFDPKNLTEMTQSLLNALKSKNENEIQESVEYAKQFNWEATARGVLNVFEQVKRS